MIKRSKIRGKTSNTWLNSVYRGIKRFSQGKRYGGSSKSFGPSRYRLFIISSARVLGYKGPARLESVKSWAKRIK